MDITKLLGLKIAGPKDRARISEVTTNFVALDEFAENWNGFSNTGTVKSEGIDFAITPALKIATELFSLTVKMPRAFAEGDTITVDGVAYNLYQGTDPALSDAWKAGEVVTINFDKVSRRCWASAGGGAPRPLPAQVSNMQASTPEGETPSIVFTWTNPSDENFAGMVLIIKEGSAPNGVTDGVQAYKGTGTTFTYTEGVQWEHTYFARGFAYNSQNKYQLDATGAIASATPSDIPDQVSDVELVGSKGSMTLTWVNPTQLSFDKVKVIQKIDSDPENPNDGTEVYSGTDTTVTVNGLQDSINYHFAIFAIGKNGKYKDPVVKTYTPKIYPKYDYTGQHTLLKDNAEQGWWRIKFLSSGVLTWLDDDTAVDVFLVGGGSGGQSGSNGSSDGWGTVAGDGGCGGFTKTYKNIQVRKNQGTNVVIGAGGSSNGSGGSSSFAGYSASGGTVREGGSGGGGGGYHLASNTPEAVSGGRGGADGADGEGRGGKGQGSTTREFGELGAALYSGGGGGGGGGGYNSNSSATRPGYGGSGSPTLSSSGGRGGNGSYGSGDNIGGSGGSGGGGYGGAGGGGGSGGADRTGTPGSGGRGGAGAQGIVIIRDARG